MMQEVTWAAVGLLAVTNTATWLKIIYDRKSNGKKNGSKENHYPVIMENRERSKLNKQAIEAMCKTLDGMKNQTEKSFDKVFNKLDKLTEKVK